MNTSLSPQTIALLLGGTSAEREVSLQSGRSVADALTKKGHRVEKIDPAHDDFLKTDWSKYDIVFIALHGTFGEDGQVQAYLDQQGVRYTGSGTEASRIAFNKTSAKNCFLLPANNVPTPPFINKANDENRLSLATLSDNWEEPLVVKPNEQGSSIGVSIVHSEEELSAALSLAQQYQSGTLIEKMIIGTEFTLALIDDEPLPLIQLKTTNTFYDYTAKYQSSETQYLFEFDLPKNVIEEVIQVGVKAAQVIGTRGIARVDIMVDQQHQPWVLEVNTIPGMTSHSLVPKAAQQAGISFEELCEMAIISALKH